jgi:hypothetical protein
MAKTYRLSKTPEELKRRKSISKANREVRRDKVNRYNWQQLRVDRADEE